MTFILTEKHSVAKAFAHALAVPFTGSYYKNNRYLITNCLGHLFQAFDPEDYEVHYKKWSLSDLPIILTIFDLKRFFSNNTDTAG